MVIDTSALLAILFDEPERRTFNEAIEAAESRKVSAAMLAGDGPCLTLGPPTQFASRFQNRFQNSGSESSSSPKRSPVSCVETIWPVTASRV
jgi:hypothetical protein